MRYGAKVLLVDSRVLVTGGASFIGSHLVERLVKEGSKVTVVDDLSSGSMNNLASIKSQISFKLGDLRDSKVAEEAVKGQDIIYHLANIHGGRGFIETHPGEISQNFLIDGNILRATRNSNVQRFCYASSACVYPVHFQEVNPLPEHRYLKEDMANPFVFGLANADGVYGWGKLMGELALKSYNDQFQLKGVSCRLFTVYGPRENESHAIIAFIARALLKQDPYVVWGSGNQDRNFTYVGDVVEGIIRASKIIEDGSAINIGTNEITTIKDAISTICDLLDFKPKEFSFDLKKPEGVSSRAASTELQERILGWKPQTSFKDGISKTINWYKETVDLEWLKQNFETRLFQR